MLNSHKKGTHTLFLANYKDGVRSCVNVLTFITFYALSAKFRKATLSFVLSVRPSLSVCMQQLGFHWWDFHEIYYLKIFRKTVEAVQFFFKSDKTNGYFTWIPPDIFDHTSLSVINVSDKSSGENQNTSFTFNNFFFENRDIYEIMWKNILLRGKPQMTIWRMSIACCIHKATNTHSEYVKRIAFRLQKWLHKHASILRYTYTVCLVTNCISWEFN